MIFVNSMSDLFHEEIPDEFIERVFGVMAVASQHTFQILTKRPERMREYFASHTALLNPCGVTGLCEYPLENVWLGVSVESQRETHRVVDLLETPAAVRFVSAEPLLGAVDFTKIPARSPDGKADGFYDAFAGRWFQDFDGYEAIDMLPKIHWLICGGESGKNARPTHPAWARKIRDDCVAAGVPFFMKQGSGLRPGQQNNLPDDLWGVKEFPHALQRL